MSQADVQVGPVEVRRSYHQAQRLVDGAIRRLTLTGPMVVINLLPSFQAHEVWCIVEAIAHGSNARRATLRARTASAVSDDRQRNVPVLRVLERGGQLLFVAAKQPAVATNRILDAP
jgi:hypothetical protein